MSGEFRVSGGSRNVAEGSEIGEAQERQNVSQEEGAKAKFVKQDVNEVGLRRRAAKYLENSPVFDVSNKTKNTELPQHLLTEILDPESEMTASLALKILDEGFDQLKETVFMSFDRELITILSKLEDLEITGLDVNQVVRDARQMLHEGNIEDAKQTLVQIRSLLLEIEGVEDLNLYNEVKGLIENFTQKTEDPVLNLSVKAQENLKVFAKKSKITKMVLSVEKQNLKAIKKAKIGEGETYATKADKKESIKAQQLKMKEIKAGFKTDKEFAKITEDKDFQEFVRLYMSEIADQSWFQDFSNNFGTLTKADYKIFNDNVTKLLSKKLQVLFRYAQEGKLQTATDLKPSDIKFLEFFQKTFNLDLNNAEVPNPNKVKKFLASVFKYTKAMLGGAIVGAGVSVAVGLILPSLASGIGFTLPAALKLGPVLVGTGAGIGAALVLISAVTGKTGILDKMESLLGKVPNEDIKGLLQGIFGSLVVDSLVEAPSLAQAEKRLEPKMKMTKETQKTKSKEKK